MVVGSMNIVPILALFLGEIFCTASYTIVVVQNFQSLQNMLREHLFSMETTGCRCPAVLH